MSGLRVGVVGCGHLGRIHARLLAANPSVHLVAVADPCPAARSQVALDVRAEAHDDYRQLIGNVDAVILAAPTGLHVKIAEVLLDAGVDLLIEKPISANAHEALGVTEFAEHRNRVLAVGHVERFNPAFVAAQQRISQPRYIEATRTSGFSFRSMDVGVVLDLMIHDIELVLSLVDSPVKQVSAEGMSVLTSHEDFGAARLEFENGTIAQLKASRVCPHAERRISIYGETGHAFVDLGARKVEYVELSRPVLEGSLQADHLSPTEIARYRDRVFHDWLPMTPLQVTDTNPLADEQQDFFDSIVQGRQPRVPGSRGTLAVWIAQRIMKEIERSSPQQLPSVLRQAS